jgi:hypothetical protein
MSKTALKTQKVEQSENSINFGQEIDSLSSMLKNNNFAVDVQAKDGIFEVTSVNGETFQVNMPT